MTPPPQPIANPYVGPRTFTRDQGHLYFGREREAQDLLARVLSERLVLFYAQSGAGKSSLINTRLIPNLWGAGYVALPVARVGGEAPAGIAEVGNIFLFNLMLSLDQSGANRERLVGLSLAQFLAGLGTEDGEHWAYAPPAAVPVAGRPAVSQPYVLIVDQFEEIITGHPGRWEERAEFFRQLNQAMMDDPDLWVVLTLREDYIAPIEPYAPLLADRMRARFYMERMDVDAALKAVRQPAELAGRPFAPGVAEQLVDNLRQVRVPDFATTIAGQYVEPVQLQVVCFQLWDNLDRGTRGAEPSDQSTKSGESDKSGQSGQSDHPTPDITFADLATAGNVDEALTQFYEESLAVALADAAAAGVSERQLRAWFDEALITEAGARGLVHQGKEDSGGLPNGTVRALQRRFLVRTETRGGDAWIELVHDRLVEPIRASNAAWFPQHLSTLQRQAALWKDQNRPAGLLLQSESLAEAEAWAAAHEDELEPHEREFLDACRQARAAAERERRQSRIIRGLGAAAMGVAVLAVLAAIAAGTLWSRAQQQTALAEAQKVIAEDRTEIARMLLGVQRDFLAQTESRGLSATMLERQRLRLEQGASVLASGAAPKAPLPEVVGANYADALARLDGACEPQPCLSSQVRWEANDKVAEGLVLGSDPQAGEELLWGTAVTLTVSQGQPLIIERPVQMELVPIPAGRFLMGSDPELDPIASSDEGPQHTVNLPTYYIGKDEVTNGQYAAFIKATAHAAPEDWENGTVPAGKEDHPVVYVSWDDGVAFTEWLSEETGRAFRLCTEAEWEKACRGTTGLGYPWADTFDASKANTLETRVGTTTPVGTYSPAGDSPYGAADMAGNVWEWTSSMYKDYPYDPTDGREDTASTDVSVLRGGSFYYHARLARCALRVSYSAVDRDDYLGLRVCVSPGL